MYRIIKGIKTKPEPGDKNNQKWLAWWSDKWGWRGIRDSADNSLGMTHVLSPLRARMLVYHVWQILWPALRFCAMLCTVVRRYTVHTFK